MAEPARTFAFDAHAAVARSAALAGPGVTIAVYRPASMLNVRGPASDPALARAMLERFGSSLPSLPNTVTGTDTLKVLWLGPDEWLVVSAKPIAHMPALGPASVTDVSHGRAVLRVSGPDARAALAKGCGLDLHPREFPVGRCAQTAIAKVSVILNHGEPGVFDLYCPRSYAGSFWHWLTEACAEYGCNIA